MGEEHSGQGRTNYIQWSLGPNAPDDALPSMLSSQDSTRRIPSSNQEVMEEDQGSDVMVDAASSPAAPALFQPGQSNEKEITIDKQPDEKENLVVEHTGIQQNQALAISNSPMPIMINNMLEEQRDCEQREAISGFLVAGLRQIFNGQIALGTTGTLRNLPIPSSLSLGINSLNIILNFLDQNTAATISVLSSTLQITQIPETHKSLPSLQPQPVDLYTRSAPITRVYHRIKFKDKAKGLEETTISVEPSSQHEENIFPASPEEYVPAHSTTQLTMPVWTRAKIMWQGKGNVALLFPPRCLEEAQGSLKSLMGIKLL